MTIQVYTEEERKARYAATVAEAQRLQSTDDTEDTRKLECPYEPKTADALEWALRMMSIDIRLNDRSHMAEWRRAEWVERTDEDEDEYDDEDEDEEPDDMVWRMKEWEPLTDEAKRYLRDEMQKRVNTKFGRDGLEDSLGAMLYKLHTDPLLEYFKSRPTPVGRNILHKTLAQCMKVDPAYKELAEWASTYMFLGVVWRTFKPGTKLDEIPVLVGGGGIGKSHVPRPGVYLKHIPGLYGSGLELNSNVSEAWLNRYPGARPSVEMSEMVGLGTWRHESD